EIGGKVREIFLYQKIILFASKKPHSCRNTWKMYVFDPSDSKTLLTCGNVIRRNEAPEFLQLLDCKKQHYGNFSLSIPVFFF
ncbi:hypothetical protein, partial [Leptospira weilii]